MNRQFNRLAAKGFTLIELLIVVIIIAILAAIAIPQFAASSTDAQESALSANLSTMRSAIELYRVQHRNVYPAASTSVASTNAGACTTAGGTVGTGAINTNTAFIEQLTTYSTVTGETCTVRPANGNFTLGPYIRTIPVEQISNPASNAIAVVSTGTQDAAPTAATGGYVYDNRSGRIIMNSNAVDRRNVAYSTY